MGSCLQTPREHMITLLLGAVLFKNFVFLFLSCSSVIQVRGNSKEELKHYLPKENGTSPGKTKWTVGEDELVRKWGQYWGREGDVSDLGHCSRDSWGTLAL